MIWQYGLCDLDGNNMGPITKAYERKLHLPLDGLSVASVRLSLFDPLVDEIFNRSGDVLLKVYQGSALRFIGDLMTAEEVAGGDEPPSVALNFAGPLWRLQKRLCGQSTTGGSRSFANTNRNQILTTLLTDTNGEHDTGIRVGTVASLSPTSAGPWSFKPIAEVFTEIAGLPVPPYAVRDSFDRASQANGTWVTLTAQVADEGGTWRQTSGTGNDVFYVYRATPSITGRVERSAVSDGPLKKQGCFAVIDGAPLTDLVAQTEFAHTAFDASQPGWSGLMLRAQLVSGNPDPDNCFLVFCYRTQPSGQFGISAFHYVGGTPGTVFTYTSPNAMVTNTSYKTRVTINAAGDWTVELATTASPTYAGVLLSGNDPVLATGGALDEGYCGAADWYPSATACRRVYDNFFAYDPTDPLGSLDFELEPVEPLADSNQSGVVGAGLRIADLNISAQIGQEQPNAIFEYGLSAKSYHRTLDRQGLVTRAYCLPQDWTTAALAIAEDTTAIADRGFFVEVVPTDVIDALLRQAVAELHVDVRKEPRQIIVFEPSESAPVFGTDYVVGDFVTARAKVGGSSRFNGQFRVYGVGVSVDDEGKATVSPVLVPETA